MCLSLSQATLEDGFLGVSVWWCWRSWLSLYGVRVYLYSMVCTLGYLSMSLSQATLEDGFLGVSV